MITFTRKMNVFVVLLSICDVFALKTETILEVPVPVPSPDYNLSEGVLPDVWIHGSENCDKNADPRLQIHRYNSDTFILRQNKCINYDAPFIFIFFGDKIVYQQDTAASSNEIDSNIQKTVEDVIALWITENNRTRSSLELVVAHSHAHGDHTAGDIQFLLKPHTTLVSPRLEAVRRFFNITNWPQQIVEFDLGGRVLDIIPLPGHEPSSIAIYDRNTGILLTNDSLYPGRLYVQFWNIFRISVRRLRDFASEREITHILGNHIEMTRTPGVEYPIGTTYQPNEHVLQLDFGHLLELDETLQAIGFVGKIDVHNDFIIMPVSPNFLLSPNNPVQASDNK